MNTIPFAGVPSTIKHVTYSSTRHGPKLLVLGGVHGNETCGPTAINRVLAEFDSGAATLAAGEVTFVPVCNPEAAKRGVRFVDRNLNRFLVPVENPDTYEAHLGNMLCPLLEQCDVLLDLHSYTVGGDPFTFVGPGGPPERAFADSLGPTMLMTGWESAYAASGKARAADPDESVGTTEYARRYGAIGVTLECGQHNDATAPEVAYHAIHNALGHLGLADRAATAAAPTRLVTVKTVIYRDLDGTFERQWKNLDPVAAGQTIATYVDGSKLAAPDDGFIIMPHFDCPIGQEWYYFGTE